MKKAIYKLSGLALILAMTSCSVAGPFLVTDNAGVKTGVSSYNVVFGFKPMNADASIATAAKNGGITKVATVDFKVEGKLFKTTYSTVVTGE